MNIEQILELIAKTEAILNNNSNNLNWDNYEKQRKV